MSDKSNIPTLADHCDRVAKLLGNNPSLLDIISAQTRLNNAARRLRDLETEVERLASGEITEAINSLPPPDERLKEANNLRLNAERERDDLKAKVEGLDALNKIYTDGNDAYKKVNATLKTEVARLKHVDECLDQSEDSVANLEKENDTFEAENKSLRAALEAIRDSDDIHAPHANVLRKAAEIALNSADALKESK